MMCVCAVLIVPLDFYVIVESGNYACSGGSKRPQGRTMQGQGTRKAYQDVQLRSWGRRQADRKDKGLAEPAKGQQLHGPQAVDLTK